MAWQPGAAAYAAYAAPAQETIGNVEAEGRANRDWLQRELERPDGAAAPAYAAYAAPAYEAPAYAAPAYAAQAQDDEPVGIVAAQGRANRNWLEDELRRNDGGSKRKRNPKRKTRRNRK
jgi:hypothetical protein